MARKGKDMTVQHLSRKSRLLARLQEIGADPKRSLGQNFLISDVVVGRILAAVRSAPFSELIEVGPGLGAITEDLLEVAKGSDENPGVRLTLIELDRRFVEQWRTRSAHESNCLRVVEGDALQVQWSELSLSSDTLFVSNLPYQISSSLVIERSLEPAGVSRMILMFQKEVAQRIAASARTEDYGLLTVIAQTFWETSTVTDAGPKDFYPPPNVASRVLSFRRRQVDPIAESGALGATRSDFLKFVKAAFSHRRKFMIKNLLASYFGGDKERVRSIDLEGVLAERGHLATARAEELDPQTFVRVYLAVRSRIGAQAKDARRGE
jgi:16S rRNA (adenine1518-N6/adenine1519-N6)-dimethyltransferase